MHFLEMKDISERHMELVNPISAEKLLRVGRVMGLQLGQRVIDPEWAQVYQFLRDGQDEYLRYGREHLGWAVYLLRVAAA